MYFFPLPNISPEEIFAHLADEPYSLFFDSNDKSHPLSRYSYIAYRPFETLEVKNKTNILTSAGQKKIIKGNPFDILKTRLLLYKPKAKVFRPDLPPFQGGAAGFFGYELSKKLEKLPNTAKPHNTPFDMAIGLYNKIICFDHEKKQAYHLIIAWHRSKARFLHMKLLKLLKKPLGPKIFTPILSWQSNFTKETYKKSVQTAIDYIFEGDIFQVNLSQKFTAKTPKHFDFYNFYLNLRKVNPAPFSGYMNFGNSLKLASSSPEQFLSVYNKKVLTSPIKGTRPRIIDDEIKDKALREDLFNSEKEKAENTMIVDLLRNDLSKECEEFSIQVHKLCQIESFASVHHLVSTIFAKLKKDSHPAILLKSSFPGGSITGAPKIRAMEIIDELEPQQRGPYCGSMGFIGFNDCMETNILIRTIIYTKKIIHFHVGGGIVSDSIPSNEYQETLDKAKLLFKSLQKEHSL